MVSIVMTLGGTTSKQCNDCDDFLHEQSEVRL